MYYNFVIKNIILLSIFYNSFRTSELFILRLRINYPIFAISFFSDETIFFSRRLI